MNLQKIELWFSSWDLKFDEASTASILMSDIVMRRIRKTQSVWPLSKFRKCILCRTKSEVIAYGY